MLPEQIWDQPDLPKAFMYLGKPCGAAMPLMWAHAEYIKLLRSSRDQRVFDLIDPVAERYLQNNGRKDLEVWKLLRRVRGMTAGNVLRIVLAGDFVLRWSVDGGETEKQADSVSTDLGLSFFDIPTSPQQRAPVQFTFVTTAGAELNGQRFEVSVDPV
jgi:glucoamylase